MNGTPVATVPRTDSELVSVGSPFCEMKSRKPTISLATLLLERLMPVIKGEMGIPSDPTVTITPAHAAFVPAARVESGQTAASTASS